MKKEVIVAIIVGFSIGLVITFGAYRAQRAYNNAPNITYQEQEIPQNTIVEDIEQTPDLDSLVVSSPANESISKVKDITIMGQSSPSSYITAVSSTGESFSQADDTGSFSIDFELDQQVNIITLTSVSNDKDKSQTDLTIFYLPESTNPIQ